MSQPAFAKAGGVQKRAQINYEKDERQPDAAYLSAIAQIGVDVLYVLTDQRLPNAALTPHLTEAENPVTQPLAAESRGAYHLSRREQALLENYRGSDEQGRRAVESTASALAHRDGASQERKGGK